MLIRSISGIRGLVNEDLKNEEITKYANALHDFLDPGVIYAGRDSRPSGEEITEIMIDELVRLGRTVIYCGIVPTPTVQFMVHTSEAVGGFIITASHNPIEWNGIKFLRNDSTFFHQEDCEKLFYLADNVSSIRKYSEERGMLWEEKNAIYKHTIKCSELKCINLDTIRDRKFKVVIDAVNGAGANALPEMLNLLGCEVVKLDCEPSGVFKRGTEPLPVNLSELSKQVLENNADLGFAVDPDADRLAVVDEKGRPLGEEYTLVLSVDGYINTLGVESDIFVSNLSTSIALDKLALKNNCKVERSAVGEINVVNKMNELDSNLGGEGNGGVILRECHLGRDSLVAVTMVLNRVAQATYPLSEIYNSLPQFEIVKDKVNVDGIKIDDFLSKVNNYFKEGKKNTIDGLKITWQEKWVHLRASNTEPIIRIYAEAPIKKEAEELVLQIKSLI